MFARFVGALIFVSALITLAACEGGLFPPAPTATPIPTATPSPVPTITPTQTPEPLNSNTPDYVKDVVALPEGIQAFSVYFTLADSTGRLTTSDGAAFLDVVEDRNDNEVMLYSSDRMSVKRGDFIKTKVGLGAFEHDSVILMIGRLPYSNFALQPREFSGKVRITFITSHGEHLVGETSVFFDN
jgi:hypothetical protein